MERDIVDRLREMAGPIVPNVCTEAADEIERLRAGDLLPKAMIKLRALKSELKLTDALAEIERLRAGGCARDQRTTQYCAEAVRLQAEIERLIRERDAFKAQAADEIERLREERNEAQREICRRDCKLDTDWINSPFPMRRSSPEMFAKLYGWNCFKEAAK